MVSVVIKSFKYLFFTAALIVSGLLIAPFVIDVNNYRVEISKQVEAATGRQFTVAAIHASLFPWLGLELQGVRMANASGFSRPDFLRAKRLQIQVEVMPLLNHEVVIRSFRLIEPQIFLERNSRGEGNWQDLLGSSVPDVAVASPSPSTATPQRERSTSQLPTLVAHEIVLNSGHVGWRSSDGRGIDIDDINLTVTDLQQLRPVNLALSGRVGGASFRVDGKIGPLGDLAALDAAHLPVQLKLVGEDLALSQFTPLIGRLPTELGANPAMALDVQLEQRPDGMRVTAGRVTLTADAPAIFHELVVGWRGELNRRNDLQLHSAHLLVDSQEVVKLNGTVTQLATHPRFNLRIQSAQLSRNWLSRYLPALNTLYAAHPDGWQSVQVGALVQGDSKRVGFTNLQLMLNGESLQGEGSLRVGRRSKVRLNLSGRVLHLDPWLPQPKEQEVVVSSSEPAAEGEVIGSPPPTTGAAGSGSVEPDLRSFASWQADIRLAIDTLTIHNLDLTHFQVAAAGKEGRYRLDPLSFALAGGQVREVATININHYPLTWTESLHLKGVEVGPVLRKLANIDTLDGTLVMKTSLHGSGIVAAHATKRLSGSGSLSLRNGSIKGFDIAGTLRNLTSFQHNRGAERTDFSALSASFTIRNGVVDNRDLFISSPLFRLTGYGTVDLVAKQLDYHAKPKLVGTLIGQGDTLPVRKGLAVPVAITGDLNSPKIRPEIDPMTLINSVGTLLQGAGSGAGKLLKGVTDGVGAGLGGALGALLGGGSAPPTPPSGELISPKVSPSSRPALISPPSNRGGGALISPPAGSRAPATPPPTQQQLLQDALGGLLNRL
ncbi:MAG: AsmA family protein [Mariprofundales bacterium]|nr:AsmA family protein [Mariprofundales bacterium]